MGDIAEAANDAWRDYQTDLVPSSGKHEPLKVDIRATLGIVDSKVEQIVAGNGTGLISFATTTARNAFVHDDPDTVGVTAQDLQDGNQYYSNGAAWVLIGASQAVRLTAAEADIVALEAADVTLAAADTALDARVDAAEATIAIHTTDIDVLEAAATALDGRLDSAEASIATHDGRLDDVEDSVEIARSEVLADPPASELASMWSATVTGEPSARAEISDGDLVLTGLDGRVIRVTGASTRAPRAVYRLLPGHKYEVLAAVRRSINPTDPLGDSVSLRAAWLSGTKSLLSAVSLEDYNLVTGTGLRLYRKIVALSAGAEVDIAAAANTVYFTPYVETYGSNGVTDILPYIRVTDLTSNTLVSADVTGLNARVTALESLDAGDRLDALETITATPKTAWFATVAAAEAATIGASVDRVVIFGDALSPDVFAVYERVGSGGDFESDDGQDWLMSYAAEGTITKNTTFEIAPSGGDFTEPGAFTAWLERRRIMPGVTVTANIADGTYACTQQIIGHVDGQRLKWTNDGLVGSALVGADFAALDAMWIIDRINGIDSGSRATAKAAAEVIVRAKYQVILEFDGAGFDTAICINNRHSGDWTDCPCLVINTGTAEWGATTGTGIASGGGGPGGVGIFAGSCFFGFDTFNLIADFGGIFHIQGLVSLFAGNACLLADFTGGFYGADTILIGGLSYGYRSNHGGFAYIADTYIRGCNAGLEATNTPGMYWAHGSNIQYNFIGVSVNFGGSGKVSDSTVKNNARFQITVGEGNINAQNINGASTALFGGLTPVAGVNIDYNGSVKINEAGGTSVLTGHTTDIYMAGGAVANIGTGSNACTYGTAKTAGGITLTYEPTIGIMLVPPTGRPGAATVEVSGTTITLPNPCPHSVGVVQPSGSAGTPITVDTIVFPDLGVGTEFTLVADRGHLGETVTVVDGSTVSLSAPSRVLVNVRDLLTLFRPQSTLGLNEKAYKRNQNNASGDTQRVRTHIAAGAVTVTRDDDVVIIHKVANEASAIALEAAMNFDGSKIVIKDGKGDAATYNLTITPGGSKNVDGSATYVISANNGRVHLIYGDGEWNVLGT